LIKTFYIQLRKSQIIKSSFRYLVLFVWIALSSCSEEKEQTQEQFIASVDKAYLTLDELKYAMPSGLSPADSLLFVEQYVQSWIKEQVVVQKAEEQLPDKAKDVHYQLEDYRKSLLIFAYEQQYIKSRLDTNVAMHDIETYYNNNLKDFSLRDYIIKAVYFKYTNTTPDLDKMNTWYKLKTKEDWVSAKAHASLYAVDLHTDTVNWIYMNDMLSKIPLTDINKSSFLKYKHRVTFEENGMVYFLKIIDYKLKDESSPLEFEKEKIKGILLNLKMNDLRKELKNELYKDAKNSEAIKIY